MNKTADWTLLIGRLALIALYTTSAVGKFGALEQTASMIGSKGFPFAAALAFIAATAELIGALCIAIGYRTRAAALGLILYTIIVTIAFHGFWGLEGAARFAQYIQFMKNVGLIGGLIVIAGIGSGAYSLDAFVGKRRHVSSAGPAKQV
jgi:putative oxidoreductase